MNPLAVALLSASALVRAGLRTGLAEQVDIDCVFEGVDWAAGSAAGFGGADVVVVELADAHAESEPDDDAPADAWRPGPDAPPRLLLLPRVDARAAAAWRGGASVLSFAAPLARIVAAAHATAHGLVTCEPAWLPHLALPPPVDAGADHDAGAFEPLTPREREVLAQMSAGLGNRAIAQALHISPHTAKFHVGQVIAKLDATSRAHAVARGLRAGLVEV